MGETYRAAGRAQLAAVIGQRIGHPSGQKLADGDGPMAAGRGPADRAADRSAIPAADVTSTANAGSLFTFRVPRISGQKAQKTRQNPRRTAPAPAVGSRWLGPCFAQIIT